MKKRRISYNNFFLNFIETSNSSIQLRQKNLEIRNYFKNSNDIVSSTNKKEFIGILINLLTPSEKNELKNVFFNALKNYNAYCIKQKQINDNYIFESNNKLKEIFKINENNRNTVNSKNEIEYIDLVSNLLTKKEYRKEYNLECLRIKNNYIFEYNKELKIFNIKNFNEKDNINIIANEIYTKEIINLIHDLVTKIKIEDKEALKFYYKQRKKDLQIFNKEEAFIYNIKANVFNHISRTDKEFINFINPNFIIFKNVKEYNKFKFQISTKEEIKMYKKRYYIKEQKSKDKFISEYKKKSKDFNDNDNKI